MLLSSFNIDNFRNLSQTQLDFNNNCNIFYGKNGSGKTSLLEAIYYLALGRSFRSHILRRIIKYKSDSFSLFGKIQQKNNIVPVGITRSITTGKQIKMAGKEISSNIADSLKDGLEADPVVLSQEVFFGASANDAFANGEAHKPIEVYFLVPRDAIQQNKFYLGGKWHIRNDGAENKSSPAKIVIRFNAKDVYFTADATESVAVEVNIDDEPAGVKSGKDVKGNILTIQKKRRYHAVSLERQGVYTLELVVTKLGLNAISLSFE